MVAQAPKRSNKSAPKGKKPSTTSRTLSSVRKTKPSNAPRPLPKQVKTKPGSHAPNTRPSKKRRRTYTDKELNLPELNMISPVGVEKPKGKKKGKIFVDDKESMITILAMVNAEKEGAIESKMIKARRLEELRNARRNEAEMKEKGRREKVEGKMREVKGRKKGIVDRANGEVSTGAKKGRTASGSGKPSGDDTAPAKIKKKVSFA